MAVICPLPGARHLSGCRQPFFAPGACADYYGPHTRYPTGGVPPYDPLPSSVPWPSTAASESDKDDVTPRSRLRRPAYPLPPAEQELGHPPLRRPVDSDAQRADSANGSSSSPPSAAVAEPSAGPEPGSSAQAFPHGVCVSAQEHFPPYVFDRPMVPFDAAARCAIMVCST
ncbi:hypothetical protein ACSSS7_007094 [Eimeria intestinalis]